MSLSRSGHVCAAKGCINKTYNCDRIFFRFPSDIDRSEIWAKAAGRKDLLHKNIAYYKLCEDHFDKKWVHCSSSGLKRFRLHKEAVPTIFRYPKRSLGTKDSPKKDLASSDSSNVSVDLLTENPSGELSCGKRKGIIAYRINKFQKLDSGTTIAASEPSTSAATRPSNELESIYFKEEPLETVQEECQLEVKIENDEFTEGSFVEPLVYPAVSSATDALDDTSKLDSAAYIEQIIESKSDLVTLFHKLSQLAKGMNPLDQAVFQNKVSNAVFQMKIQQLSKTN